MVCHGCDQSPCGCCDGCNELEARLTEVERERDEARAEVERLRAGIEAVAAKLQGLGHETPWKYGRELRVLIEPPFDTPDDWAASKAGSDAAGEQ